MPMPRQPDSRKRVGGERLAPLTPPPSTVRWRIEVQGVVQGVGFRPFIYRLAAELGLDGWVRNDAAGVTMEVEGDSRCVERMVARVRAEAPARARVDRIAQNECVPVRCAPGFAILESGGGCAATAIGPDSAVCPDCLAELFAPGDRRYRYAFTNCTNCGPRYTITRGLPYDRARTSMAAFAQCPACAAEYASPRDRRFHAEPNACPDCGPRLRLLDCAGGEVTDGDPLAATLARLARGEIVAIKGLGGFHLACNARDAGAVARLRARKSREEKPFAVMVAGTASLQRYVDVTRAERALLESPERPVVLLRKGAAADVGLAGVAPGLAWLGAMLPYTPLHYLLFHEAAGRPPGLGWLAQAHDTVLVMTSANPGGEPLVTRNDEAQVRLAGIADAFLVHDRDIVIRCDDSVVRAGSAGAQFVRRARGYTPLAIRLAGPGPTVAAVGGWYKNTVCVTRGDEAFVSQHIGDLDNAPTCVALEDTLAHLVAILDVRPDCVAHDLHPDFFSTRHAAALAARWDVPLCGVQHHHAHVAAVLAEHRVTVPALGLALDGVGVGTDGAAWGGELLRVDGMRCERLGRLRPLRLAGGDRAAREPWRMAAAALALAGRDADILRRFAAEPAAPMVARMLARAVNAPETSSMGRWFDAAAGLLDVKRRSSFEGQAAMLLEGLAERHGAVSADPSLFAITADNALDLTPLVGRLCTVADPAFGAALVHAVVVAALAAWVGKTAREQGIATVACGGGCFLNAILARGLRAALSATGITMLEAQAVPPNDGGLALGQAWVARHAVGERR
jgi:hydrogenase maturation protein HypF